MRKSAFCMCENKGADQLSLHRSLVKSIYMYFRNPKVQCSSPLRSCTAQFVSDLVRNPDDRSSNVAVQIVYRVNPYLSPTSFLWYIGKHKSLRCDTAIRGVPSGAILFAYKNFIEKRNKNEKLPLMPLKLKVDSSNC